METLIRINSAFESVKNAIKTKKSSELLNNLKKDIENLNTELASLGKENHDQFVRSVAMEGYLTLLAVKSLPRPLAERRDALHLALDKLKPFARRDECLFVFLRIQNLLCYYLIQLEETALAQNILDSMEDLYDWVSKSRPDQYVDAEDLFSAEPISNVKRVKPEKIDKIITNNVQMQAFLYNKLNMPEKYTIYSHTALRRQLEMKDGTPQEWSVRAARLGSYFSCLGRLANARHHLAAAYHVLRTCHDNCKLMPDEFVMQKADFEMRFLELSHHWVKYGLTLFKTSKQKILSKCFSEAKPDLWKTVDLNDDHLEGMTIDGENDKDIGSEKNGEGDFIQEKLYEFPTLNLSDMESKIPSDTVSNVEEARRLFSFTHKWLMRAKHYYDIEHYPAQYISCSLQLTELYEHLAFFETNVDNQYNLQKRRADALETLNSLLKTCDNVTSVQIDVIRELSQVQLELMALNLQKLWREESHTNVFNLENDADSVMNSLDSASNKTLTEKTLNMTSKSMFLRKMEAVTSINGKLFRLSGQLTPSTPSRLSLNTLN